MVEHDRDPSASHAEDEKDDAHPKNRQTAATAGNGGSASGS
jgi:hypothetical protein